MRRRVITRVTTSVRSCLAAKTSSGTARSIPFRYNRRSCHCLPVSIKSDIRTSLIAFKPVQQCLSEAIFHLRLHIPLSLGTPYIKVLRGFPCSTVYTCTLFFHEFSIWENRNTFPMVCKRGISGQSSIALPGIASIHVLTNFCLPTNIQFSTQNHILSRSPQQQELSDTAIII